MKAGIDVGAYFHYVAVENGDVIKFRANEINDMIDYLINNDVEEVYLEPTGRYHIPICKALLEVSITPFLVHTTRFGRWREMNGKSKNDKDDAILLMKYSGLAFEVDEKDVYAWELADLIRERIRISRDLTRETNRLRQDVYTYQPEMAFLTFRELIESAPDSRIIQNRVRRIDELTNELKDIEKDIKRMVINHEDGEILISVPGISYITAGLLISRYVDISRYKTYKHFQAMMGFAVITKESGKSVKAHRSAKAHIPIRAALYRVVIQNARKKNKIGETYRTYRKRMPHKKATMRTAAKILVWIYHMLKRRETWNDD